MEGEGALTLDDWAGIAGLAVGVLSLIVAVVAWLTPSARDVAEDLREDPEHRREIARRLRGAALGTVYHNLLAGGLAFLDRRMGAPGSARALGVSILLAIVYAWGMFALAWGLGAPGTLGGVVLLEEVSQPVRAVMAAPLALLPYPLYCLGAALGRRAGRAERRCKLKLRRRLRRSVRWIRRRRFELVYRAVSSVLLGTLVATLGNAGSFGEVVAFGWFFSVTLALSAAVGATTAVRTRHAAVAVVTAAAAGAVVCVCLFLVAALVAADVGIGVAVGAGVGVGVAGGVGLAASVAAGTAGGAVLIVAEPVTWTGIVAVAVTDGAALALTLAVAVGAAGAEVRNSAAGRGALPGVLGAVISFGILGGYAADAGYASIVAVLLLLFFLILPVANGLWDWLSWFVTRRLGTRLLQRIAPSVRSRGVAAAILGLGLADLAAAVMLLLSMAFALAFGFEAYNQVALRQRGVPVFGLEPFIASAAADPWFTGFWLTAMLGTTLLPTFLHGFALIASPLALAFLPDAKRLELAVGLESYDGLPEEQRGAVRRRAGLWLSRARFKTGVAAVLLFLAVLALLLGGIGLLHHGGFADLVRDAAHAGISCARWLGRVVLGNPAPG